MADPEKNIQIMDPEVVEFLGNGKNMDEAPLAKGTSPVGSTESLDPEILEFLVKGKEKAMPLAPKEAITGARR